MKTPYRLLVNTVELKEKLLGDPLPENMEVLNEKWTASYLTPDEYSRQLMKPDSLWYCPYTGLDGVFDDDYYEKFYQHSQEL